MHDFETKSVDQITKQSKTNFYYSFTMLPKHKRDAIHTVYAFCKCTDDIVDEGGDESQKIAMLKRWTLELEKGFRSESQYSLLNQLNVIAQKFGIPYEHFFELIRGMEMDLHKKRYETFEELVEYCYKVASTVGLMCSEIFGYKNERTKEYAVNLGIALQLTNIVRDVRADAERGRIYIPKEDFDRFGYSEADLFDKRYSPAFQALMKYQCDRARTFFTIARNHLAEEDRLAFFAARIMDRIYSRILDRIEEKNYNVFLKKISISTPSKFLIVLKEFTKNYSPGYSHASI